MDVLQLLLVTSTGLLSKCPLIISQLQCPHISALTVIGDNTVSFPLYYSHLLIQANQILMSLEEANVSTLLLLIYSVLSGFSLMVTFRPWYPFEYFHHFSIVMFQNGQQEYMS